MKIAEAKAIVLAACPGAKVVCEMHYQTAYYSIVQGEKSASFLLPLPLSAGWLTERGAWNAAAEVVKPGCTNSATSIKSYKRFQKKPKIDPKPIGWKS